MARVAVAAVLAAVGLRRACAQFQFTRHLQRAPLQELFTYSDMEFAYLGLGPESWLTGAQPASPGAFQGEDCDSSCGLTEPSVPVVDQCDSGVPCVVQASDGKLYRLLDGYSAVSEADIVADADGHVDWADYCQLDFLAVPEGWSVAPATAFVRTQVVAALPWSTPSLCLGNAQCYATSYSGYDPGEESRPSHYGVPWVAAAQFEPRASYTWDMELAGDESHLVGTVNEADADALRPLACNERILIVHDPDPDLVSALQSNDNLVDPAQANSLAGADADADDAGADTGGDTVDPAEGTSPSPSPCPAAGEVENPDTLTVDGNDYRLLQATTDDVDRVGDTCQETALCIPEGWTIAPRTDHVISTVIALHPWGTHGVCVADGSCWYTSSEGSLAGTLDRDPGYIIYDGDTARPDACNEQILLVRPTPTGGRRQLQSSRDLTLSCDSCCQCPCGQQIESASHSAAQDTCTASAPRYLPPANAPEFRDPAADFMVNSLGPTYFQHSVIRGYRFAYTAGLEGTALQLVGNSFETAPDAVINIGAFKGTSDQHVCADYMDGCDGCECHAHWLNIIETEESAISDLHSYILGLDEHGGLGFGGLAYMASDGSPTTFTNSRIDYYVWATFPYSTTCRYGMEKNRTARTEGSELIWRDECACPVDTYWSWEVGQCVQCPAGSGSGQGPQGMYSWAKKLYECECTKGSYRDSEIVTMLADGTLDRQLSSNLCETCPHGGTTDVDEVTGYSQAFSADMCRLRCDDWNGWQFDELTESCIRCPHAERCIDLTCVEGTRGHGCAACSPNFFQRGPKCIPCPEALVVWPLALAGSGCVAVILWVLWRISRAEGSDMIDQAVDVQDAVNHTVALRDSAIVAGVVLPNMVQISLTFTLPFGWPDIVVELAQAIASIVSFDFGWLASPECTIADIEPFTSFCVKTVLSYLAVIALGVLLTIPSMCGEHNRRHATNARTALYTLAFNSLVTASLRCIDCTHTETYGWRLDILPEQECWAGSHIAIAAFGCVTVIILAFVIPGLMFRTLNTAHRDGKLHDPEFAESHAWMLLKYRDSQFYFELVLLLYRACFIAVSVLMNSTEGDSPKRQLFVLVALTAGMLLVVCVTLPFRDSAGEDGFRLPDKVMVLGLVCQLMSLGIGYVVLTDLMDRNAQREADLISNSEAHHGYNMEDQRAEASPAMQTFAAAGACFIIGAQLAVFVYSALRSEPAPDEDPGQDKNVTANPMSDTGTED